MKKTIIPNLLGRIQSVEIQEGETIETKVARITQNKEPITDSAPIIFTEKKDGVLPAYNIRTDRFDIALEAMDKIGKSKAKKENAPKPEDFGHVPNKAFSYFTKNPVPFIRNPGAHSIPNFPKMLYYPDNSPDNCNYYSYYYDYWKPRY